MPKTTNYKATFHLPDFKGHRQQRILSLSLFKATALQSQNSNGGSAKGDTGGPVVWHMLRALLKLPFD